MPWSDIVTEQSPNWQSITVQVAEEFEFSSFAELAFSQGCFADGLAVIPWSVIPTPSTSWTTIST